MNTELEQPKKQKSIFFFIIISSEGEKLYIIIITNPVVFGLGPDEKSRLNRRSSLRLWSQRNVCLFVCLLDLFTGGTK
jgi:hypothetical protein